MKNSEQTVSILYYYIIVSLHYVHDRRIVKINIIIKATL